MENFDTLTQFRFLLEIESIRPIDVKSIKFEDGRARLIDAKIFLSVFRNTDDPRKGLSDLVTEGFLKILNYDGSVQQTFKLEWSYADFIPFTEFNYNSSESLTSCIILRDVIFEKVNNG